MTPQARQSDPATSHAAAHMAHGLATDHRHIVLAAIREAARPIAATELVPLTGLTKVQICRRLPELQDLGFIRVAQGTHKTAAGRPERLWRLA